MLHPFFETRTLVVRRGTPEDRPSAILWYYVHSWRFLLDVISACCPLLDAVWPPLALSCAVRLIFVLSFIHKLEKATKASPSIVRSIQIMLGALPAMHWFACIFCYLALSPGSWLESYQLERGDESINASDSRIYLHAVYWTLDTASTRGSGEMNASSDVEVIVQRLKRALNSPSCASNSKLPSVALSLALRGAGHRHLLDHRPLDAPLLGYYRQHVDATAVVRLDVERPSQTRRGLLLKVRTLVR